MTAPDDVIEVYPKCPVCNCCHLDKPNCDLPAHPCTVKRMWARCRDSKCGGVVVRLSDMHVMGSDFYGGKSS